MNPSLNKQKWWHVLPLGPLQINKVDHFRLKLIGWKTKRITKLTKFRLGIIMITDNIMEFCDKDRKLFKFYGIQSMERNTLINIFDLLQLWAQNFSSTWSTIFKHYLFFNVIPRVCNPVIWRASLKILHSWWKINHTLS